jgi:tRNA(fMet)-specific endonuclease VapC
MYILDTNVITNFLKADSKIVDKITKTDSDLILTCTPVEAELFYAVELHPNLKTAEVLRACYTELLSEIKILPFCSKSAKSYAKLKSFLKQSGTLIEDFDLLIASIAFANDLILVTSNTKHFARIENLKLEDWTQM